MDYSTALQQLWVLADKPERMRAFHEIVMDDEIVIEKAEQFWEQFWSIWTSSENLNDDEDYIRSLMEYGRAFGDPHSGLEDDEAEALKAMPDRLTIYRGCVEWNKSGWSWTLDRKKAEWFANRCFYNGPRKRLLLRAEVDKAKVLAYLTGRGESEVVIDPDDVEFRVVKRIANPEERNAGGFYYAIQSGRFDISNPDLDKIRAEMNVQTVKNPSEVLPGIERDIAFCERFGLTSKLGMLREMTRLLKEKMRESVED